MDSNMLQLKTPAKTPAIRRALVGGIVSLILLALPVRAGAVEIRLASPLPHNSDWGLILDRIAAEWYQVTNGEVVLNISHQRPGS
ncbi:MAG: hypothetical protein LBL70_06020, partial [Treponema sp.]|nr:hypothetical protein [Treponema sp.]